MKIFKLYNNIAGWVVFAIAAFVYLSTIESSASFWDCGEFIATAYKLEVGHPPGAPFFMLITRIFTLFAPNLSMVPVMVNAFSALCSGFCIMFLFWTITHLARKLLIGDKAEFSTGKIIAIIGSGLVGALIYTFSDTFWFSAVEGEVYACSSLFTALVFWAILKWEDVADRPYGNRWLVFIAYLMGLSVGVHLLNLLTIPALVLVYYFKKYDSTIKGVIIALLISFVILAALLFGLIPGFVEVAGWFELLFVNVLGASFNVGTFIYAILLIATLVWAILVTYRDQDAKSMKKTDEAKNSITSRNKKTVIAKGKEKGSDNLWRCLVFVFAVALLGIPFFGGHVLLGVFLIAAMVVFFVWKGKAVNMATLNTTLICLMAILLGYSTYATIVIRSAANPPMDQNSPDDVFALKGYLNRDQYGAPPLLHGESYASALSYKQVGNRLEPNYEEVDPVWAKKVKASPDEKDEYIITEYKRNYKYVPETTMFFPRLFSKDDSHVDAYKEWGDIKGRTVEYNVGSREETTVVPTFGENLRFFFTYQVNFMYWRYFMWNFAGRQNDIQGNGEITHGNWISGINAIDNFLVGDQTNLPDELKNNKGHNTYYFLPLLLGLFGLIFQFMRGKRGLEDFLVVAVFFFMTGLAIVLYLNQTPYQPRERDYAYAGSFYVFAIWTGLGVLAVANVLSQLIKNEKASALIAALICLPVPIVMAEQNWDDHDRSGRTLARDYGQDYLMSLAPNAVVFTYGDNDTFPLWYNQEVEGVRTDARVANLSYLQTSWYVDQMKRQAYQSDALPISLEPAEYSNGKLDVAYLMDTRKEPINLRAAIEFLKDNTPRSKRLPNYDEDITYLPGKQFYLPVDAAAAVSTGTVKPEDAHKIVPELRMNLSGKSYIAKSDIVILDMLQTNEWKRPMYYAVSVGSDNYLGMRNYFQLEGFAYRIVPINQQNNVNTDVLYDNLMHKFKWGGIENPKIYLDENALRMPYTARSLFIQLAEALISEGKKDSAAEVLDHCMQVIPTTTVPHNIYSLSLAQLYYQLGQKEKANAIMDEMLTISNQYLNWLSSVSDSKRRTATSDFYRHIQIFREILRIAQANGYNELYDKNYPLFEKYAKVAEKL